ncbi:unnamed protein product, partial [Polarella glacialis]
VSFGHPVFDRTERAAAVLGTVSQEELIDLFERHIATGTSRACLVTAVAPETEGSSEE